MSTTNPCANTALYKSLRFCKGKTVLPGLLNFVYCIKKSLIAAWPTLKETPTASTGTMAEIAQYSGDFTLETGAKFQRIDVVTNKGNITYETQGEVPSRTFLNKMTVTYPEGNADALGFARQAIADDLVFLVPQRRGGFRVLGNEKFETDIKPAGDTGEGITGTSAASLEIEVTDVCPAPYYTGVIETEDDGDIDATTGKPVEPEP